MTKKIADEGDHIAIPGSTGKWALAKVLYASNHYKDVILLGILPGRSETPETLWRDHPAEYERLVYTGRRHFHKRGWRIVGHSDVSEAERDLSTRIVAGNVWKADDFLRPASRADEITLKQMDVAGHIRVENLLNQHS